MRPAGPDSNWTISKLVAGQEDALIDEGFGDEDVSALARAAKRRPASPSD